MKEFYLEQIRDEQNLGSMVDTYVYLEKVKMNSGSNGREYATLLLSDCTSSFYAKMWSESLTGEEKLLEGNVVHIQGKIGVYDGLPSFVISIIKIAEEGEYVMEDIVGGLSEEDKNFCKRRIMAYIKEVKDASLNKLLLNIFTPDVLDLMCDLPAGLKMHHNFNGGLIVHTLEVCDTVAAFSATQERYGRMKKYYKKPSIDLLVAGALLHDIGKILEYTSYPVATFTEQGRLVGHLTLGDKYVDRVNECLGKDKVEDLSMVSHVILSSHGESGMQKPMMQESIIVSNADNLSAESDYYDIFWREYDNGHPGDNATFAYSSVKDVQFMRKDG